MRQRRSRQRVYPVLQIQTTITISVSIWVTAVLTCGWQSGPINGDGNTTGEINSINQIYGKAEHNTYVVIPWSETEESPTLDPVRINIQKEDSETGNTSAQGAASLAGAEFTMRYYAGTSVSGTPARTWVIRTDSNGRARLDDAHLVSGTLYTDSDEIQLSPSAPSPFKRQKRRPVI